MMMYFKKYNPYSLFIIGEVKLISVKYRNEFEKK
jgi:hypothetical protein